MKVLWLSLDRDDPFGLPGWGIPARDEEDALRLLEQEWDSVRRTDRPFSRDLIQAITRVEDLSQLEANHVRINMGNFLRRGIWWPGFSRWSP